MTKNYRLILFLIEIVTLVAVAYVCTGSIMTALSNMWFSSGLLMILLLSLIDQPFFSKDSNVFVNAVTAFLALIVSLCSIPFGSNISKTILLRYSDGFNMKNPSGCRSTIPKSLGLYISSRLWMRVFENLNKSANYGK